MALINEAKNKGVSLLDLVMTGEAARICAVDRRTFMAKAEKYKIKPAANPENRALYYRKDVEFLARKIREEKHKPEDQ